MSGGRLLAKYDLIAVEPGRRAGYRRLEDLGPAPVRRLAGRALYRRVLIAILLATAGTHLNAPGAQGPFAPEQIEMIYWFAVFPAQPERLRYNRTQHEADGRYLASLIAEIAAATDDYFPLTTTNAVPVLSLPLAVQPWG